jgi:hypothetical protein
MSAHDLPPSPMEDTVADNQHPSADYHVNDFLDKRTSVLSRLNAASEQLLLLLNDTATSAENIATRW